MSIEIDKENIDKFLLALYDSVQTALSGDAIEDVALTAGVLEHLKSEVGELLEQAKTILADRMGSASELDAVGYTFEKKQGLQRKSWDHQSLSRVVADRMVALSVDLDTGEILKSPAEMIKDAFAFAGVSYWRVKELQKIGVNADSFCEVNEGKTNIIIRSKA